MAEVARKGRASSFEPPFPQSSETENGATTHATAPHTTTVNETTTALDPSNLTTSTTTAVQPTYFRKDALTEPIFSVDTFLKECRSRVSMPDLQTSLTEYHSSLSNAMFALINKDYGDFLSLSANLAGLDKSIGELTSPLQELKKEVVGLKTSMDAEIKELDQRLHRRVDIRAQRTLLQRFLNISASVDKIEKLLSSSQPSKTSAMSDVDSLVSGSGELIERVASEFNQLQFYVTQCQRGTPFLSEISPRIKTITNTLQDALELTFRKGIEQDDLEILRQCLRTYSIIDKVDDVEALFRELVVLPFASQTVTKEKLAEVGLDQLYREILIFVKETCQKPMQIAVQLNISGCNFLVNSVWPEMAEALMKLTPIFSHGIADEFHKNFMTTEQFVSDFEHQCGTQTNVEMLRAHQTYVLFRKRWSIQVYYQLRFQEIAGEFETKLSDSLSQQLLQDGANPTYKLGASVLLIETVQRCWSPGVYIPGLCHRFWKLTLQLIARYGCWVASHATEPMPLVLILLRDCDAVQKEVAALLTTVVRPAIKSAIASGLDISTLEKALAESCAQLMTSAQVVQSGALNLLTVACEAHVKGCLGVSKFYRHMKKPIPESASEYVEKILKPVQVFMKEHGAKMNNSVAEWIIPVCRNTTKKFVELVSKLLVDEGKMENRLLSLKKIRKKKTSKDENAENDHDKIRLQLWLDVTSFTTEIEFLGVFRDDVPELENLRQLVDAAKPTVPE